VTCGDIQTFKFTLIVQRMRNTAISLHHLAGATSIAAALRHHAAHTQRPITLLLTS